MVGNETPNTFAASALGIRRSTAANTLSLRSFEYGFIPGVLQRINGHATRCQVSGPPQVGDLVFFDEHGDGISHVGIYSGNGKLIHASSYFGKVTESEMKYIKGYVGATRLL